MLVDSEFYQVVSVLHHSQAAVNNGVLVTHIAPFLVDDRPQEHHAISCFYQSPLQSSFQIFTEFYAALLYYIN